MTPEPRMRPIVFQMMTTLDGRLDDPMAWVHEVGEDQYRDIEQLYGGYDTVLVGRRTYEEMAAYWPGVLAGGEGTETNRRMARRMHDCRKLVFSRTGHGELTPWHNVERVVTPTDDDLVGRLLALKAQPGGAIHLSGGAGFAQSVLALGLVDEFHFFVYPVMSPGERWFARLGAPRELALVRARAYASGVVGLQYVPRAPGAEPGTPARAARFTELLTE